MDSPPPQVAEDGTFLIDYSPGNVAFDPQTNDLFHRKGGLLGADDKAGLTTMVQALRTARAQYWDKGSGHRRILVVFTAQHETGGKGVKYLVNRYPSLFTHTEITLLCDWNRTHYPRYAYEVLIGKTEAYKPQYAQIAVFMKEIGEKKKQLSYINYITWAHLLSDAAPLPAEANSRLAFSSPYRGVHRQWKIDVSEPERVNVADLVNHVDLFAYLLLRLDGCPAESIKGQVIAKDTMSGVQGPSTYGVVEVNKPSMPEQGKPASR
jgi:putative aminopeptidase FrvX